VVPITTKRHRLLPLRDLLGYAACTVILAAMLSGYAVVLQSAFGIWRDLVWWNFFRRCASIAGISMLLAFMRHVDQRSVRSLGLGPWRAGRRQLLMGLVVGLTGIMILALIYVAMNFLRFYHYPDTTKAVVTLLGALPAMVLVAVFEELIFRGYVLQHLLPLSRAVAIVLSSAAYALVHLRTQLVWPSGAFELTGLFILGAVLAMSVLWTKQLYMAIGLHASLAYAARVNKMVVEFAGNAPRWLVGTSRLVNGIAAWLALVVIGCLVAHLARRQQIPQIP